MKKQHKLITSVITTFVFLGGTGLVWYQAVKPALTNAFAVPGTCDANTKGCYSEDWTATELTGDVAGFDFSGYSAVPVVRTSGASFKDGAYATDVWRVQSTLSLGTSNYIGVLATNSSSPVVTKWHVDGDFAQ